MELEKRGPERRLSHLPSGQVKLLCLPSAYQLVKHRRFSLNVEHISHTLHWAPSLGDRFSGSILRA